MEININGDNNVVHNNVTTTTYNNGGELPRVGLFGLFGFFLTVVIVIAVAVEYWQITLAVVSLGALAVGHWLEKQEKAQAAARAETEAKLREAELSWRAESQNEAYLRGDPQGVYGNFPPPPEMRL